jgi:Ser/Thr protein kinase RdoA (MazF antagonist)
MPNHPDRNLIIYKNELGILQRVRNANAVSGYLARRGVPARTLADVRILKLSSPTSRRYAALYDYLPGDTIPWEAYTRRHLVLLGCTMSDMHHQLADIPPHVAQTLPRATDELRVANHRMADYFSAPGVQNAAARDLHFAVPSTLPRRFSAIITITARLPHNQPLHMDFVRGNVLFLGTATHPELSGILDFEKVACGPPIIDVARTLAFLLVDSKYKSPYHIRKYFLSSGYNKRGQASCLPIRIHASSRTINLLEELVTYFLVYDLYKFMRHNPYQSLAGNEHYTRTISLLQGRGVIQPLYQVAPALS